MRQTVHLSNYYRYFSQYKKLAGHGPLILAKITEEMRFVALKIIGKGYKPTPVDIAAFLVPSLDFDSVADATKFVKACGGVISPDGTQFLTGQSEIHSPLFEVCSCLFVD